MKTNDALEILHKAFSEYSFHYQFIKELGELLKRELKGKEKAFFKCLATQLNQIKTLGILVNTADDHEIIKGFDGHYYSIHLRQNQFNIRFLTHISSDGAVVFLCAFYERSGHHKTSYQDFLPVLEQRFREIQGVDDYE